MVGDESAESGLFACPVLWDLAHGESDSISSFSYLGEEENGGEKSERNRV